MKDKKIWDNGLTKEITFIVTKDCQLACKYCYLVGKNSNERMSIHTAKEAVDYILSHEDDEFFASSYVVFDFIGGEPFLEIDLIDEICDYLNQQMNMRNHHWLNSYKISFTTNGINYNSPKIQKFIKKNIERLHITITIDGTRRKHDMNRIWKGGSGLTERGSYDNVVRNVPLWLSQFPEAATKVTISSADIPFVAESVLHLFSLGIKNVNINCVFEDVWKEGDDIELEKQLRKLAKKMIDLRLYPSHYCSFFDKSVGHPMDESQDRNWCGAGRMLSIDASGNFYPCTRFAKYSLREKEPRFIGNIREGIDKDRLRPFYSLSRFVQSPKKCIECNVASGCAWCQGENYDASESGTIFQRSTAICKMHKARVRANEYFWNLVGETIKPKNDVRTLYDIDKEEDALETLTVLLSNNSVPLCDYEIGKIVNEKIEDISELTLKRIIEYATKRNVSLQFVYPRYKLPSSISELVESVSHKKIMPLDGSVKGDATVIENWNDLTTYNFDSIFYILRSSFYEFYSNVEKLRGLLVKAKRLNIIFYQNFDGFEAISYAKALTILKQMVVEEWRKGHLVKINILTDRLSLSEMSNCNAGSKSLTLAPNGKFYICPAFYYENPEDDCGDIVDGIKIKNPLLYKLNHSAVCRDCKAYQCNRCIYLNKKKTLEVNTPSFEQCEKSRIELEVTKDFFELWKRKASLL